MFILNNGLLVFTGKSDVYTCFVVYGQSIALSVVALSMNVFRSSHLIVRNAMSLEDE
jgi:hypothetical protein